MLPVNDAFAQFPIEYNDVQFLVNPELFKKYSPTFAKYYQPGKIMKIRSEFPASAFQEFLPAVQEGSVKITKDNYASISFFAKEWEVSNLLEAIKEFETRFKIVACIDNFQKAISNKEPVDHFIPEIAANFDAFISHQQFACTPIEYIKEILQSEYLQITDYPKFLKFSLGMASLTDKNKSPSILNYIDVNRLTMAEMNNLIQTGMIQTENPAANVNKGILLKNLIFRYRDIIEETQTEISITQNQKKENEKKIGALCSKIKKTKKQIQEQDTKAKEQKQKQQQQQQPKPAKSQSRNRNKSGKQNRFVYIPDQDQSNAKD